MVKAPAEGRDLQFFILNFFASKFQCPGARRGSENHFEIEIYAGFESARREKPRRTA